MYRHIAGLQLVLLAFALLPMVAAQASDCVSWEETTDLPDIFPDIHLSNMAVVGSLLLGAEDQVFYVYRLEGQADPELVSSVPMENYVWRLRVCDGIVYLIPRSGTSHWVDLTDPANPVLNPISVPAGDLFGVLRFDGGYLMLSSAGSVFVVDDLTAPEPSIISAFEASSPNRAAAYGSMVFVAMSGGLLPVDLADPANPVVGETHHLHPPGYGMFNVSCQSLMVHEGVLYGQFGYYNMYSGANFTMAVDISDPFEPVPIVQHAAEWGVDDGLEVVGNLVVALTSQTLRIYETGGLHPLATVRVAPHNADAGAVFGEDLLIAVPYRGLYRVDLRNPFTVESELDMPDGYDPAGCGRYGLATVRSYTHDWQGNAYLRDVDWTIYDQTSVADLDSLAAGHRDVHSGDDESCGYTISIADANDRWVVVRARGGCSGWNYSYGFEDLVVHDLQTGDDATVDQREHGWAALVGDVLWTLSGISYNPKFIETFQLTDDGVVPLGSLEVPYNINGFDLSDVVVVWKRDSVLVLSLADPHNLTLHHELQVDQSIELGSSGFVEDGLLFVTTDEGVAVIDIDPAFVGAPVVIGTCDLDIRGTMVRQGDRAIVYRISGWQAVDFSDPTTPMAASPAVDTTVVGMHWSGDLLYINHGSSVHLYDVADVAAPRWVGQSTYQHSPHTSPCCLDGYVMSAEHALLPDCNDPAPIDPIDDDDPVAVPSAVSLSPVAPNPFNPTTTITFELRHAEHVELVVHDLRGRRLRTILDRQCPPGGHRVTWDGRDDHGRELASGAYLVQLRTPSSVRSTKAVLVR